MDKDRSTTETEELMESASRRRSARRSAMPYVQGTLVFVRVVEGGLLEMSRAYEDVSWCKVYSTDGLWLSHDMMAKAEQLVEMTPEVRQRVRMTIICKEKGMASVGFGGEGRTGEMKRRAWVVPLLTKESSLTIRSNALGEAVRVVEWSPLPSSMDGIKVDDEKKVVFDAVETWRQSEEAVYIIEEINRRNDEVRRHEEEKGSSRKTRARPNSGRVK